MSRFIDLTESIIKGLIISVLFIITLPLRIIDRLVYR